MRAAKRWPAILLALTLIGLFFAAVVCLVLSRNPVMDADIRLRKTRADNNTVLVVGEAETPRRLKNVRVRVQYTTAKGSQRTVTLDLGDLEAGINTVEMPLLLSYADFNDPTIVGRESSGVDTLSIVGFGCLIAFGGTILLTGLVGIIALQRKSKASKDAIRKGTTFGSVRQETLDPFGGDEDVDADESKNLDDYNTAAASALAAFAADEYFLEDPSFYDRIGKQLESTGSYPIVSVARLNDFFFCLTETSVNLSWENVLREVCRFCYDDLDGAQQATADSGDLARAVGVAKDIYDGTQESILPFFYALYPKLSETHTSQGFLLSWERFLAYAEGREALPDKAAESPRTEPAEELAERRNQTQNHAPTGNGISFVKAAELVERDPVAVTALILEWESVRQVDRAVRETGKFPAQHRILTQLDPREWPAFLEASGALTAQRFSDRLDRKTAKAIARAEIDEKAALFRDLPGADRPEMKEGFFYTIYQSLGDCDIEAKRDRFERLIAGRFG